MARIKTAVILAGGKSRRMGRDKLSLSQGDKTVLEAAVERFSGKFDKVYLSVGEPDKYPDIKAEHIEDIYKGCGPIAGLHAALKAAEGDGVFLVAADLPFSSPEAALKMIELCGSHEICVIQDEEGRYEPLFGYYRKNVFHQAERILSSGGRAMTELFSCSDTHVITPEDLGVLYNGRILSNMNYPEDYSVLLG